MAKPRVFIEELKYIENSLEIFEQFRNDSMPFILDSALLMEKYGRYSIISSNPRIVVRSKNGTTEVVERGLKSTHTGNPLEIITEIINKFGALELVEDESNIPFTGGAVGYFGYDLGRRIERIPSIAIDDQRLPDCYLGFYDEAIIIDHKERRLYAIYFASHDTPSTQRKAMRRMKAVTDRIERQKKVRSNSVAKNMMNRNRQYQDAIGLESNFSKEDYKEIVRRAQKYISDGDIFQVNLAQRFSFDINDDHYSLYCRLRESNPAPFAAFLSYDKFSILSSSPERFMYKNGRYVETRPIKGTRPRFADKTLDDRSIRELLDSQKDSAEHIMIVDVKRNDLGRVCEYGSVDVPELMVLESYESVHHLVSTVTGKLKRDIGAMDLIKASFPGGSITGAPKIRAMEIIEELEPQRRNVYCGSIGYISTNGKMDTNIAIRMITAIGDKGYMQVGGGIVVDSNPDDEYDETLHKGRAIFSALTNR